jgi:transcriptional regulator with XRE-family HTH domain
VLRIDNSLSNGLKRRIPLKDQRKMFIGQALKRVRISNGMSQEELAGHSSLDRTSISKIERNRQEPGLGTLDALSEAFNMGTPEFIKELLKNPDEIVIEYTTKKSKDK